jgi:tetratricopeptide (TPR) repeat protein
MNRKISSTARTFFCTLLIASLMTPAANAVAEPSPYSMLVIDDRPSGKKVLSGKFDAVIEDFSADKVRVQNTFAAYTNICVAYAKSKQVEKAIEACDVAVAHSQKMYKQIDESRRSTRINRQQAREDLAVALSNRGVLFAVNGRNDKAMESFESAVKLDADQRHARANMSRLTALDR